MNTYQEDKNMSDADPGLPNEPTPVRIIHEFAWNVHDSGGRGFLSRNAAQEVWESLAPHLLPDLIRQAKADALEKIARALADPAPAEQHDDGRKS